MTTTRPDTAQDVRPGCRRLVGYKAIASHLKVSERTARRWAADEGLPVHQDGNGRPAWAWRRAVERWRAERAGLDAWWDAHLAELEEKDEALSEALVGLEAARRALADEGVQPALRRQLRDVADRILDGGIDIEGKNLGQNGRGAGDGVYDTRRTRDGEPPPETTGSHT